MKGITHSSSTLNRNAINVLRNMGYSSREHWTKYKGGTEVSDALLGIKYVINNECKITENPYALDIIQPIENELDECEVKNENPFIYQNDIYRSLSGIDKSVWQECEINGIWSENLKKKTFGKNVRYTPIDNTKNSYIIFDAEAQKTGEIYCFFPTDYEQYANISVNGRFITEYFDYNNYHIVSLGSYSEGERLNIRLTLLSDTVWLKNSEYFYTIDKSVLNEMTNTINRSKGTAKLKNDHTIEGSFTLNTDGSVYTSIPYEPGWIIKIDGETVDYYSFADGLIAFNVQSGNHEYEMKYIPPGFISGIIISALAVAAVLLLEKYRKTHLQKHI